jgi:hypothetical protein
MGGYNVPTTEEQLNLLPEEELNEIVLKIQQSKNGITEKPLEDMSEDELNDKIIQMQGGQQQETPEETEERLTREALDEESLLSKPEASLGFSLRARYALEPLRSNRIALLQRELGPENVRISPNTGNIFVRDKTGQLRPVNEEGISAADIAEIAGALPEAGGAIIGAMSGAGLGSVPMAAVGGAAGSALRQGLSASLGTPQVAEAEERAKEIALSATIDGLTAGFGKLLKPSIKKAAKSSAIKKAKDLLKKDFSKKLGVKQVVGDLPSGHAIKLAKSAKELELPRLTRAQMQGGPARRAELILAELPVAGKETRKMLQSQKDTALRKLDRIIGEKIIDRQTSIQSVNEGFINSSKEWVSNLKNQYKELYDKIDSSFENTFLDNDAVKNFRELIADQKVLDLEGNIPSSDFHALSGLAEESFESFSKMAKSIDTILKDGPVNIKVVNTLRKTIDSNIDKALSSRDKFLGKRLVEFRTRFSKMVEQSIDNKDVVSSFKKANEIFAERIRILDKLDRIGIDALSKKPTDSIKMMDNIFKSVERANEFKDLFGERAFRKAGEAQFLEVMTKLNSTKLSPARTISALKNKSTFEPLRRAIGDKKINDVIKLMELMTEFSKIPNPPQTALVEFALNPTKLVKFIRDEKIIARRLKQQIDPRKIINEAIRIGEKKGKRRALGLDLGVIGVSANRKTPDTPTKESAREKAFKRR